MKHLREELWFKTPLPQKTDALAKKAGPNRSELIAAFVAAGVAAGVKRKAV